MRRLLALLVVLLALGPLAATPPAVVFLVRHAEKASGDDRGLTEEGLARAAELARALKDSGLTKVLATDTERARATAAPVARMLDLPVEIYDPRALDELAARLREAGGRTLVIGHSNTTPALVRALGGDPGPSIEESEHDRLYVVTLLPERATSTVRLRYGASSGS